MSLDSRPFTYLIVPVVQHCVIAVVRPRCFRFEDSKMIDSQNLVSVRSVVQSPDIFLVAPEL